jgi:hypothetical protein
MFIDKNNAQKTCGVRINAILEKNLDFCKVFYDKNNETE